MLVTLDDIRAAATRIRGVARRTPVLDVECHVEAGLQTRLRSLSSVKTFNRAARSRCAARATCWRSCRADARAAGVITYSSGNHGQAVALVARSFGMPAVIVMPETAPRVKVDGVRHFGAEVIFAGTTSADRKARAEDDRRGARAHDRAAVRSSVDHRRRRHGGPRDSRAVSAGDDDLRADGRRRSDLGRQCRGERHALRACASSASSRRARRGCRRRSPHSIRSALERSSSIADGLLTLRPGDLTFAHVRAHVDEVVTVDDAAMVAAVKWLFHEARLVAEPSGAAAVAAALRAGVTGSVAVVSGGNVDPAAFAAYTRPFHRRAHAERARVRGAEACAYVRMRRASSMPSSTLVIAPSSCFS